MKSLLEWIFGKLMVILLLIILLSLHISNDSSYPFNDNHQTNGNIVNSLDQNQLPTPISKTVSNEIHETVSPFSLYPYTTSAISTNEISIDTQFNQLSMLNIGTLENFTGQGYAVGIIDSGVDGTHQAFEHTQIIEKDFNIRYPAGNKEHGTSVASLLVGRNYDGAPISAFPEATLYSAKIGVSSIGGQNAVEGDFVEAFKWLLSRDNMLVISISISGTSLVFTELIEQAYDKGVAVVSAAGNFRQGEDHYYSVSGPGQHPKAFNIGAVNSDGDLASFSSIGPDEYLKGIDFVAQGVNTYVAISNGGYGLATGTSFSAPLFAGALGMVLQYSNSINSSISIAGIKGLLAKSTGNSPDLKRGFGIPDFNLVKQYIDNNANAFVVTPSNIPLGIRTNHLRGSTDIVNYYTYSTNQSQFEYIIEGNISQVVSNISTTDVINEIRIRSNNSHTFGRYQGILTLIQGELNASITMAIDISQDMKYRVLLQLGYTIQTYNYQDRLNGHNLYEVVSQLTSNGFHFVEGIERLHNYNLSKYDLVWIKDFGRYNWNFDFYGIKKHVYSNFTIILKEYLHSGGRVFIDTPGIWTNGDGNVLDISTNKTTFDNVISKIIPENPMTFPVSREYIHPVSIQEPDRITARIPAYHDFTNTTYISHYGGYMYPEYRSDLNTDRLGYRYNTQTTSTTDYPGIYSLSRTIFENSGQLVISTSDDFLDGCHLSMFSNYGCQPEVMNSKTQNKEFTNNLFSSLVSSNYGRIMSFTQNVHSYDVVADNTVISLELLDTSLHIIQSSSSNNLSIDTSIDEGWYLLNITTSTSQRISLISLDKSGPIITKDQTSTYTRVDIIDQTPDKVEIYLNSSLYYATSFPLQSSYYLIEEGYYTIIATDEFGNSYTTGFNIVNINSNPIPSTNSYDTSNDEITDNSISETTSRFITQISRQNTLNLSVRLLLVVLFVEQVRRRNYKNINPDN